MKSRSIVHCICAATAVCFFAPTLVAAQSAANNAFNPAFSVIVDGKYAHYSRDPSDYGLSGFLLNDEAGLSPKGLSLGESEMVASANVDDKFYGQVTLALESSADETSVRAEEAFVQTTALPNGLTARAGRFFSDIGYLNSKHAHAWDFVDQPLVYKALLGTQFGDDGVHVHWVAPLDRWVEVGAEAFRGDAFPAAGATHGGVGAWTVFAHTGGDVGAEHSWRAGASYLHSSATGRETTLSSGNTIDFAGSSRVWIADFVWKWSANGNPKSRSLVIQSEYLRRTEEGIVSDAASSAAYDGTADGFYVQAVYQFVPRWRAGIRYDRLSADNESALLSSPSPLNDPEHDPSRITAMLDFSNSEFSRFRLQAASDRSRPERDTQLTLQYLMSIGAHGAHQF